MDLYTFVVEDFIIRETRALHSDTLYLSHYAYVDGDLVASKVHRLGDFDNGEYSTVDYVPSDESPGLANLVINNPSVKVSFIFQLVNAGNVSDGTVTAQLAGAAGALGRITAGLAGAGATHVVGAVTSGVFPPGLVIAAFAELYSWLSKDCDGPIAADQLSGPRYVLDAWTDNATDNATDTVRTQQVYPGTDSEDGCGSNSDYTLTWSLRHHREWVQIADVPGSQFVSDAGTAVAVHNGALHAFGVQTTGDVTHARTFTGAVWNVDGIGNFALQTLPLSPVSFHDRLLVFGVNTDATIASLAYTTDGGTWTPFKSVPPPLVTKQQLATAVLGDRMALVARDAETDSLRISFTADVRVWTPWADVPAAGLTPKSPVAAATLDGTLFLFGLYETAKARSGVMVVANSTTDGITWNGWHEVESGLWPEMGTPTDQPLDVAATAFEGRVHLAVRWSSDNLVEVTHYLATNSSADGVDWAGWRIPDAETAFVPSTSAAVAGVDGHLYIVCPADNANIGDTKHVWSY